MKFLIVCLAFLSYCPAAVSQRETTQSYDAGEIKELIILTDEVYKINISSLPGDQLILTTHSEGEYFNDIHLEVQSSQHQMLLITRFDETLRGGFDKLSAHKVFALEVTLQVPHGLDIHVRSNLASVSASGQFRNFRAELEQGNASLEDFTGNAVVNTYRGNIYVKTTNPSVQASSGTGNVKVPQNSRGLYSIELRSVTGDIKVEEN